MGCCMVNCISPIWIQQFFEEVAKKINQDGAVDIIYMDFGKAIAKLPHGRVVQKLDRMGSRVS